MTRFKAQAAYDREMYAARAASAKFQKAREMYRARQIHDAAFLAAKAEHEAAQARFDAADAELKAVAAHEEAFSEVATAAPTRRAGKRKKSSRSNPKRSYAKKRRTVTRLRRVRIGAGRRKGYGVLRHGVAARISDSEINAAFQECRRRYPGTTPENLSCTVFAIMDSHSITDQPRVEKAVYAWARRNNYSTASY